MIVEKCFARVCFIPLDPNGPKLFGFSEFLAGLALMVLAWTIADVRYRFRVQTAPIPLQGMTFSVVAGVGVLTLLTDLWRSQGWLVPKGSLLTPASWQALLAGLFLLTFLTWAWFAFIRPPRYGKRNAKRYAHALYQSVLKGDRTELAVVADELMYSAMTLVHFATNHGLRSRDERQSDRPKVEAYANDLLLLVADKRLCRVIVESSPGTALAFFQEIGVTKKYGIQIETFARNIVNEALLNKDSFLYHEVKGYDSGLIGYHKPLSQAMFANHRMVETIGTLLDPDIMGTSKWEAAQWEAYCRAVLLTFRDYVDKELGNHSTSLYRAMGYIERAASDLYKLNGAPSVAWDDDTPSRLRAAVQFIKDAVEILDKKEVPKYLPLRMRKEHRDQKSFYDYLADMIFEVILAASAVKSPANQCWWIQHNSVWGELFNFGCFNGSAGQIVKFKVRRLLYNEVAAMSRIPNFKGANILGFCLNVMGLELKNLNHDKDSRSLHKAILTWTQKNYIWLHSYNPQIADTCLVDGITYDHENLRLVKTYPANGLRREPTYVYLALDPANPSSQDPATQRVDEA
ncbi:hypothetical protein PSH28_22565 [Pseudomonas resinovorans]|uniref:hypothetical protein n=1 Tax=Metapseudomonas resinovorans TaxID=53412 RepID=UPI00237F7236|nr:hypothetical protein [Pseudomonas resinovorans]MDE3739397.1 hypothetical protein [Pseudomonas resinovorans]